MADRRKNLGRSKRLLVHARARLARLAARRQVRALTRFARSRGQEAWIVGGALRDALLGRPVAEIDVAVTGDAQELARRMEEAGLGTCVCLSDDVPRVFRVAGGQDLDIAEATGGSIGKDLARRDFTINAIAWNLGSRRLVDPFNGIRDLANHRLRLVSNKNLREDPLRVLRAARLQTTHGLAPDGSVTEAARRSASSLASVAPERIRTEILKLLEAERPSGSLSWLRSVGALAPALGLPKDRILSRRLAESFRRLDEPRLRRAGSQSRRRLRLAMIAAGLGFAPAEAASWLTRRRFSREEAGDVAALLKLAGAALKAREARAQWAWVRDSGSRREDALELLALLFPAQQRQRRRLAARRPSSTFRITGDDVMRWLGIPSGPRVGTLLREIEIETMRGAVRSRGEARHWLVENQARNPLNGVEMGSF